jgi:2-methylaconitate cis-trans-isomerase PrpF
MHLSHQWLLQLSPSVFLVSISGTKALILERTLTNEKLVQSYGSPLYTFGSVRFASRTSYETKDLAGALAAMGALLPTGTLMDNLDLASVKAQIVDWFYKANPSAGQGSLMSDASPLVYGP